ncbi:MAG: FKBP-type peptidyl-prolyl cis-trans isomerase [Nitrospiraceae bacterium]|nr:FKBP-type peptidyl-prolyl cis-trans isomerase [Nitrospiraceae bacterium]
MRERVRGIDPCAVKKHAGLIVIGIVLFAAVDCSASDDIDLKAAKNRTSYSVGYQIGEDLNKQKVDFDPVSFLKGVEDALSSAKPRFSEGEMRSTLSELKQQIMTRQQAARSEKRKEQLASKEKYLGEGRDFLATNAKKEGVVTLPSGLQYKVVTVGAGKVPGPHDTVLVEYRGTLVDGTEFDSTYRTGKPKPLQVDRVIAGLREALQMMKEGAHWSVFIPADLAYGEKGPLAERAVIFDIKLISIAGSR